MDIRKYGRNTALVMLEKGGVHTRICTAANVRNTEEIGGAHTEVWTELHVSVHRNIYTTFTLVTLVEN